jgi:hypothetical protein
MTRGGLGPRRFLERRITRDAKVPRSADDLDMVNGWACIPIRPTADPAWFIVDSSHDRKTTWGRWHEVRGSA